MGWRLSGVWLLTAFSMAFFPAVTVNDTFFLKELNIDAGGVSLGGAFSFVASGLLLAPFSSAPLSLALLSCSIDNLPTMPTSSAGSSAIASTFSAFRLEVGVER